MYNASQLVVKFQKCATLPKEATWKWHGQKSQEPLGEMKLYAFPSHKEECAIPVSDWCYPSNHTLTSCRGNPTSLSVSLMIETEKIKLTALYNKLRKPEVFLPSLITKQNAADCIPNHDSHKWLPLEHYTDPVDDTEEVKAFCNSSESRMKLFEKHPQYWRHKGLKLINIRDQKLFYMIN